MAPDTWRAELRRWAWDYAHRFCERPGVLGVMIGGSLARGQEWRHSDLELGIVVEKHDSLSQDVDNGRGVEVYQLIRSDLEKQISLAEAGDVETVVSWPIALWKGRIISDPQGILGRFKSELDSKLFAPAVLRRQVEGLLLGIENALAEARDFLTQNKPAAALFKIRWAMNNAIQALYWTYGELPRSMNRTDSRLRLICKRQANMRFYALYREIFSLSDTAFAVKHLWPLVRNQTLEIVSAWGDAAREFWTHAIDSNFQWRQNAGILTVYRLYIPFILGEKIEQLDDETWSKQNQDLMRFLGLADLKKSKISLQLERLDESCSAFRDYLQK